MTEMWPFLEAAEGKDGEGWGEYGQKSLFKGLTTAAYSEGSHPRLILLSTKQETQRPSTKHKKLQGFPGFFSVKTEAPIS